MFSKIERSYVSIEDCYFGFESPDECRIVDQMGETYCLFSEQLVRIINGIGLKPGDLDELVKRLNGE